MQRAAPAKKRRLSTMKGISSSLNACRGLPALRASRSASSSPWDSSASASLSSAAWRSPGVVRDQPSKALRAAATARSTSSLVDTGSCASSSPLAGLTMARVSEAGARARPTVGDDDPLLALHDALATYPADRIVVFDDGLAAEARERFEVPVTHGHLRR